MNSTPQPTPDNSNQPPIHFLAALVTIALDWVWFFVEGIETLSGFGLAALLPTMMALGILNFATVTLVQHFVAGEKWGSSIAKGMVFGIIAGVPYPVVGTVVGTPLLVWAGIHQFRQRQLPPPQPRPQQPIDIVIQPEPMQKPPQGTLPPTDPS